jgi:hypothetical protein
MGKASQGSLLTSVLGHLEPTALIGWTMTVRITLSKPMASPDK